MIMPEPSNQNDNNDQTLVANSNKA